MGDSRRHLILGKRRSGRSVRRIPVILLLLAFLLSYLPTGRAEAAPEPDWIKAYQEHIKKVRSANMTAGEYGEIPYYANISYSICDMDQDGIPELFETTDKKSCIYTYVDGAMKELKSFEAYVSFGTKKTDNGTEEFYGWREDAFLLTKSGNTITEGKHFSVDNWREFDSLGRYLGDEMIEQMPVYEKFGDDGYTRVDQVNELLETLVFQGLDDDFGPKSEAYIFSEYFDVYPKHPMVISSYDYYKENREQEPDPLKLLKWGSSYNYNAFDGEDLDWILKNVYNYADSSIKALKKSAADDEFWKHYYHEGLYYSCVMVDREGGPDTYLKSVTRSGNYYLVEYGGEYYYAYGYRQTPNYQKRYAILELKSDEGSEYWSVHYSSKKSLKSKFAKIAGDKYAPYPVVALKSQSTGKYLSCDIGGRAKETDEYSQFNKPELKFSTKKADSYEMFYQVPCSDGSTAFQSVMNRKYLGRDNSTPKWEYDFIGNDQKMILHSKSKSVKIQMKDTDLWLGVGSDSKLILTDERKAESFELVTVSENERTGHESMILGSGEWFNLDGKGVGYWNIQNEIGHGETHALSMLGYTLMYRNDAPDKTMIEHDNMQCAIGVKKTGEFYDVIITFQGTGGFSELDTLWDGIYNINYGVWYDLFGSEIVHYHAGYYSMAMKLRDLDVGTKNLLHGGNGQGVYADIGGDKIQLNDLIGKAAEGNARFTILGHSMGGAMAQCYALYLTNCGIKPEDIKGITFNPALALTTDAKCSEFTDWYNICVSSDTVTSGLVTGSVNTHGIHRLGQTIWLYDNEPDRNTDSNVNIAGAKHNMDTKLLEILKSHTDGDISYLYSNQNLAGSYYTFTDNVEVHRQPVEASEVIRKIDRKYTKLEITGETRNEFGNKWYQLSGGGNVYWENVLQVVPIDLSVTFYAREPVFVYSVPSIDSDIYESVAKGTKIAFSKGYILFGKDYRWILCRKGGVDYWYPLDKLAAVQGGIDQRLIVACPVNVKLYDEKNELIASVSAGEEPYSKYPDKIIPYIIGDVKIIDMTQQMNVRVQYEATADGSMDCVIQRGYDETKGEFRETEEFDHITLSDEMVLEGMVLDNVELGKSKPTVVSDQQGQEQEEDTDQQVQDGNADPQEEAPGSTSGNNKTWVIIVVSVAGGVLAVVLIILILVLRKGRKKH